MLADSFLDMFPAADAREAAFSVHLASGPRAIKQLLHMVHGEQFLAELLLTCATQFGVDRSCLGEFFNEVLRLPAEYHYTRALYAADSPEAATISDTKAMLQPLVTGAWVETGVLFWIPKTAHGVPMLLRAGTEDDAMNLAQKLVCVGIERAGLPMARGREILLSGIRALLRTGRTSFYPDGPQPLRWTARSFRFAKLSMA